VIRATKTSPTLFLSFADSLEDATEDRDIDRAAIDGNGGDGGRGEAAQGRGNGSKR